MIDKIQYALQYGDPNQLIIGLIISVIALLLIPVGLHFWKQGQMETQDKQDRENPKVKTRSFNPDDPSTWEK
jgi:hypothetical protein